MAMTTTHLSASEREFVRDGVVEDVRSDGRRRVDFRRVCLQVGNIPQANGSSRVTSTPVDATDYATGETDCVMGIKLELGQPDANTPGNGKIVVEVDVSSTASPTFKGRGGEDVAAELSAALRSLLQGSTQQKYCALDLTKLSIVHGKTCWIMYIDAVVLSVGGNLLDVLSLAMKAALADTEIPKVEVSGMEDDDDIPEIEIDSEETWKLDSFSIPTTITVCQVERSLLVDPTADEEVCADSALAVGVASTGDVVGITKLGFCSIPHDVCKDMINLAQDTGKRLLQQLRLTL